MILFKKMVLIGLLQKNFFEKFTCHLISVRKQDLLNVQKVVFNYDEIGVNLTNESILCNVEDLSKIIIYII